MWLPSACVPWLAKGAPPVPLPPVGPVSGPLRNHLDQEEAEPQSEEDKDQNDTRLPSFVNKKDVEARAVSPRLGAMSVHSRHRIFHCRGTIVCIKCGAYSTCMNRKLRRECLGNPSNLGMEVLKRTANREPPTARPRVASLCRRCAAFHARSRMALWGRRRESVSAFLCFFQRLVLLVLLLWF